MNTVESEILAPESDSLASILELIGTRAVATGGFTAGGDWSMRFTPTDPLKLACVVSGSMWVATDARPDPVKLCAGDVAIIRTGAVVSLASSADGAATPNTIDDPTARFRSAEGSMLAFTVGRDVVSIGGHIDPGDIGEALLNAVPELLVLRSGQDEARRASVTLELIHDELTHARPGRTRAVRELAQYLLVNVLRLAADSDQLPPGWLRLLGAPSLAPAVRAMNEDPSRRWTLTELARLSTMSRSGFVQQFTDAAGVAPIRYLATLRLWHAMRRIAAGEPSFRQLAAELGFASDSAFSAAFKRGTGVSPRAWRQQNTPATAARIPFEV